MTVQRLTKEFFMETCKMGQGNACCKYLVASRNGLECAKLTIIGPSIDKRTDMTAKGDNCDGIEMRSFHED